MKRLHVISVRLDDDELAALEREAVRLDRSVSWVARAALAALCRTASYEVNAAAVDPPIAVMAGVNLARARDSRTKDDTP